MSYAVRFSGFCKGSHFQYTCHRHLYKVEISSLLVVVGLNESGHPELTSRWSEKVCPLRDSPFVFVVAHMPPQKGIMLWLDCSNLKSFFLVKTIYIFYSQLESSKRFWKAKAIKNINVSGLVIF